MVQGAVDKYVTPLCLASIREHLPGAEIILSTWEGTNIEGLDYDQVLLNRDPGGYDYWNQEYTIKGNTNRQIYSTIQGLRTAKGKYAAKIRTDFVFESAGFISWFNKYPARNDEYSFFESKVICCDNFSRDPRYQHRLSFLRLVLHPSDFFFFGYKDDLIDLFDIPLMTRAEQLWFTNKKDEMAGELPAFPPEEYLWVKFLEKNLHDPEVLPADSEEKTPELIKLTEVTFASNLLILGHKEIGLKCGKGALQDKLNRFGKNCFRHWSWLALYRYYCRHLADLYVVYRVWHFCDDAGRGFIRSIAAHIRKFKTGKVSAGIHRFLDQIRNKLTHEEKNALRPTYLRLRSIRAKLKTLRRPEKNYVKCFFNEDVTDENLTVMVQGPVRDSTRDCLNSVKKFLPKAEIIFSTWEGSDTEGLPYDKVVFSKDPGGNGLVRRYPHEQVFNVNRIIVSSFAGIKQATRRYCLRLRSDIILTSTDFLKYYNKYSVYIGSDAMVSRRIMVEGLLTAKDLLFDVGDWWHLGLTEDLYRMYNIPLYPTETVPYFERKENAGKRPAYADLIPQWITEQYVIDQYIRKYGDYSSRYITFEHTYDNRPECIEKYRRFVADNLLCIEFDKSGIFLPKCQNMNHPAQYCVTMPGWTWMELCHVYGTLPSKMKDKGLKENFFNKQREYISNSRYYNIENYANVIKNYASFKNNSSFPDIEEKIDRSEITFVVSGEIGLKGEFNTHYCLVSIRRFFPESHVILSTYDDADTSKLNGLYDELILVQKTTKGVSRAKEQTEKHDLNKQQRCVHAAMANVRTKYAVRMRTDQYLFNDHFLSFYIRWQKNMSLRNASYAVFRQRVLTIDCFTFEPRWAGHSYSLSDSFQFGLTEDLMRLWDGHEESFDTLFYFDLHPAPQGKHPDFRSRYTAGQCLFLNVLRQIKPELPYPKHYLDESNNCYAFEAEKVFASNILVADSTQLGLAAAGAGHGAVYTFDRLIESYLDNIEPDNQQCLSYLEKKLKVPPMKKASMISLWSGMIGKSVVFIMSGVKIGVKLIMRTVFPAYRVGVGTRDRLMSFESVEADRFQYLVSRVNELEAIQRRNETELKKMRQKQTRETKERRNGCL